MNFYNNKVTRRLNLWIRIRFVLPALQKKLKKKEVSILCNNCIGGYIYHDLGLQFRSPTINMFFHGLDALSFVEHLDYYLRQPLIPIANPHYDPIAPDYPVAKLCGGEAYPDLELHFMHYLSFDAANQKWEERKKRLCFDELYVVLSLVGVKHDEEIYRRAQNLPVKKKVILVNHPVDPEQFPDFFYVHGLEDPAKGLRLWHYRNLKGQRYYDQFDFVRWFNEN